MRHFPAVAAACVLLAAPALTAQEGPVSLSVDAMLSDYGFARVDSIRHGRVSLVRDPAGDRLTLHFLRTEPPAPPPVPEPVELPEPSEGARGGPELRALWVWNTAELLDDAEARSSFLDFIAQQSISRVFLYVPVVAGEAPRAGYLPFDGERLAPLLSQLHARGALAYALDGDPEYVRPENHAGVLATVRRVAEHNRAHPPEERFYGIRYDIEPYILPGFQGPRRREILDDYVHLLSAVAEVAHESGLRVGADIPFWFDAGDEVTGAAFEAELDGTVGPVLDHVMSTVDDIGIMAYRTSAGGPNGVILHSSAEIARGSHGWAKVFVGVETTYIYDEELYTLRGSARRGLPPLADARWIVLEELDGGEVRISLVEGQEAFDELAARAGDEQRLRYWFAGQPVPLPGSFISFHSLGAEAMRATTAEIEEAFGSQPGFLGLAFHDYRGLRELLERRPD